MSRPASISRCVVRRDRWMSGRMLWMDEWILSLALFRLHAIPSLPRHLALGPGDLGWFCFFSGRLIPSLSFLGLLFPAASRTRNAITNARVAATRSIPVCCSPSEPIPCHCSWCFRLASSALINPASIRVGDVFTRRVTCRCLFSSVALISSHAAVGSAADMIRFQSSSRCYTVRRAKHGSFLVRGHRPSSTRCTFSFR
jgi:hypothetical protein